MKLELYAVYDNKLGAYLSPFAHANDSTAIRQFMTAIQQEDHDFNIHAEDYSLWHLASYDQGDGNIKAENKVCISQAHEVLARYLQGGTTV